MFLMPKCNSESNTATAFCSYQLSTSDSGSSFTLQWNAPARATAIWIAE